MTYYYYIASDKQIQFAEGQLDAWSVDHSIEDYVDGFDVPIQLEMYSPEKEKEVFPLYLCIKYHFERYPNSIVQIANYLNSNIEDCTINKKKTIDINKLTGPKQLILDVGELMTIQK